MESSKREFVMGEESVQLPSRPAKRARLQVDDVSFDEVLPAVGQPKGRFLPLHLQFLKMLYKDEDDRTGSRDHEEDRDLDASILLNIDEYLQNRSRVRSLDSKVERCRNLYNDAVDIIQQEREQPRTRMQTPQHPQYPFGHWPHSSVYSRFGTSNRATFYGGSQQSPFYNANRMNPFMSRHHTEKSLGETMTMSPGWGLVTGILQANYRNAKKNLQKTTSPLEPILYVARAQISRLEAQMKGIDQLTDCESPPREETPYEEDLCGSIESCDMVEEEEKQARRNAKVRLWKVLYSDICSR